jgi:predicted carbohydrate-binding protein with CBM5 and CBM33 domain
MPYVSRSGDGQITNITTWPDFEGQEFLEDNDPELNPPNNYSIFIRLPEGDPGYPGHWEVSPAKWNPLVDAQINNIEKQWLCRTFERRTIIQAAIDQHRQVGETDEQVKAALTTQNGPRFIQGFRDFVNVEQQVSDLLATKL